MQKSGPKSFDAQVLSALPIFEAVVRLGSFTKAGRELGLTQSGVSRRIQALESLLGVVLFARRGRSLTITEDGLRLGKTATEALHLIEKTRKVLGGPVSGTLRVGVLHSLGALWLAPRLGDFVKKHPDISVTLTTIESDFSAAHKDPLTWGFGGWRSFEVRPFYQEEMVPVCSPEFLEENPVRTPKDIFACARLTHTTRADAWRAYSTSIGLARPASFTESFGNLAFEHFFLLRGAALAGAGIGLLPKLMIDENLDLGRLVACGPSVRTGAKYAIVTSKVALARPTVATFVDWVEGGIKTSAIV